MENAEGSKNPKQEKNAAAFFDGKLCHTRRFS